MQQVMAANRCMDFLQWRLPSPGPSPLDSFSSPFPVLKPASGDIQDELKGFDPEFGFELFQNMDNPFGTFSISQGL